MSAAIGPLRGVSRPSPAASRSRALDLLARRVALRLLRGLRGAQIVIVENGERHVLGACESRQPLIAQIEVHSPRFYSAMLRGSVGLCESYMDGLWDCEDLVSLTRVAALNVGRLDDLRRALAPLLIPLQRWLRWLHRNTPGRARKRIAAHYDLGNDLFSLFLDDTMSYSCAVFDSPQMTLEEASLNKLQRVCAKLELSADDHLLEIGTGWGGLALYAAEHYGCRVTTTTISREQHAYASERVRTAGLEGRVTVLLEDYRELRGTYDKLVSIEMIEAVGWQHFNTFFRKCSELLEGDGAMLLQAIVIEDRAYHVEKASKSFINTYVFPGGCLPSMEVISRSLARVTDLRQVHLEDITDHYALTLAHWRERFGQSTDRLSALGYDERFRRLWNLYLSYCEGGFRERRIEVNQMLLSKPDALSDSRVGQHTFDTAAA